MGNHESYRFILITKEVLFGGLWWVQRKKLVNACEGPGIPVHLYIFLVYNYFLLCTKY